MPTYQPTDFLPTPPRDLVRDAKTSTSHMWICLLLEGKYATANYMYPHLRAPDSGVDFKLARTSTASSGTRISTAISGEIAG